MTAAERIESATAEYVKGHMSREQYDNQISIIADSLDLDAERAANPLTAEEVAGWNQFWATAK